ncbi:hypothetical protein Pcinc_023175 [Petrolisthes cinctipes]|uniref:Uncharacterized protein n=1 Tax=Petrolisthes cinctipes TaxID=88211 RepID=A0AAE1FG58_PETCI|nr:hypothetical protein Pcinc_023175 [Petrolisthes cinctipes]
MKEDPEEICKLLAEQYQSVFSEPEETKKIIDPGTFFNSPQISEDPTMLKNIEFSEQDIIAAIEELKPNSAPGPDGIPTNVLIKCKDALARPLYLLWRHSLDTGTASTYRSKESDNNPNSQRRS